MKWLRDNATAILAVMAIVTFAVAPYYFINTVVNNLRQDMYATIRQTG